MPKKIILFPLNGNALEALDCLGEEYECIGFVDDTPTKQGKHISGIDVYTRDVFNKLKEAFVLAVPGSPTSYRIRQQHIHNLEIAPQRFAKVVHPKAAVSPYATLGYNVLIMAGVVITSNAFVGNHVCVLPNSVIHHDAIIGNYSLVGSGVVIAGNTAIGENCYIGSGSTLINNISVGEYSLIGLGSTIIKDVASHSKMVGNPAKNLNLP